MKDRKWKYYVNGNVIYCRDYREGDYLLPEQRGKFVDILQAIYVDDIVAEVFIELLNKARKVENVLD